MGVRHFLLEVGGELRGEGIRPDGQPWWVDVEMPPASSIAPWRIALHDLSAATSGNYRRGFSAGGWRSEEHTSELQSLMRISYAVVCLKKKKTNDHNESTITTTKRELYAYEK